MTGPETECVKIQTSQEEEVLNLAALEKGIQKRGVG